MVAELKGLMERVNSVKASRDTIEASLRDATVDICTYDRRGIILSIIYLLAAARFMSALEADQTVADESISEAQLSETYGPLQQQVADSVAQQQTLIESINVGYQYNDEFISSFKVFFRRLISVLFPEAEPPVLGKAFSRTWPPLTTLLWN